MVGDVNSQWHTLVRAIKVSDRFEVGTHTFFIFDHIDLLTIDESADCLHFTGRAYSVDERCLKQISYLILTFI